MAIITVPTKNVLAYIEKYGITSIALGNLTDTQKQAETLQVISKSGYYADTIDIMVRAHDTDPVTYLDIIDIHNREEPSHEGREDEVTTLVEKMAFLLGA